MKWWRLGENFRFMEGKIKELETAMAELKQRLDQFESRYRIPQSPYHSVFEPKRG